MTRSLLLLVALAACHEDRPRARALPGTIWFVDDAATPTLAQLTAGTRTDIAPLLYPSPHAMPDGRLVAIASRGDGTADAEQLALVSADGRVTRVGPAAMQVRDPAVDGRGRWIVVAANLDGRSDLYRFELDGSVARLTDDPQGNYDPAYLGESLVYASSRDGNSEIYRDTQRLTAIDRDDWDPTPSPDGRTLAFLSDRDGRAYIHVAQPDGSSVRRLTAHTSEESAPTWSRDGTRIAYAADGRIHVHELATGRERVVTPAGVADFEPSFSPDGRWLAVSRVRGDANDVWAIPFDGGDPVLIAQHARLPRWQ